MIKKIADFIKAVSIVVRLGSDVLFRDPLTGLYNRRFFAEVAEKEIEKARRYQRPLTFAFLDIDELKKINDTLGHQAGDKVLKKVAQTILANCRKTDIPVRWGGDEFLLLLPETNKHKAQNLIQRVTKQTEEIHLSYGIAPWENNTSSLDNFIAKIDQKMYQAKKSKKLN